MSRGNQESLRSPEYHALIEILQETWIASEKNQAEICAELGKPRNYLNKVVRGERRLDVVEVFRICDVVKQDPVEVLRRFAKVRTAATSLSSDSKQTSSKQQT